jgi:hypothetical protein
VSNDRRLQCHDWAPGAYRGGNFAVQLQGTVHRTALSRSDTPVCYSLPVLSGASRHDMRAIFELVINLKTAKALAITIPRSLLLREDEVIQ